MKQTLVEFFHNHLETISYNSNHQSCKSNNYRYIVSSNEECVLKEDHKSDDDKLPTSITITSNIPNNVSFFDIDSAAQGECLHPLKLPKLCHQINGEAPKSRVDYWHFDGNTVYLVELKTKSRSQTRKKFESSTAQIEQLLYDIEAYDLLNNQLQYVAVLLVISVPRDIDRKANNYNRRLSRQKNKNQSVIKRVKKEDGDNVDYQELFHDVTPMKCAEFQDALSKLKQSG